MSASFLKQLYKIGDSSGIAIMYQEKVPIKSTRANLKRTQRPSAMLHHVLSAMSPTEVRKVSKFQVL
jgi:hypothetical protein